MDITIPETQLISNFVSPQHCVTLVQMGFPLKTVHSWKRYYEEFVIVSDAYDPDGYYSASVTPILVPAFTIKDCENELPDCTIEKSNKMYRVKLDWFTWVLPVRDKRLPDALAIMLQNCIELQIVDLKKYKSPYAKK